MRRRWYLRLATVGVLLAFFGGIAGAQQQNSMTFFVTSVGSGKGADLGGLAGADQHCQALAQTAGAGGKTWRAYLSTQAMGGTPAVNARDRIGHGRTPRMLSSHEISRSYMAPII